MVREPETRSPRGSLCGAGGRAACWAGLGGGDWAASHVPPEGQADCGQAVCSQERAPSGQQCGQRLRLLSFPVSGEGSGGTGSGDKASRQVGGPRQRLRTTLLRSGTEWKLPGWRPALWAQGQGPGAES